MIAEDGQRDERDVLSTHKYRVSRNESLSTAVVNAISILTGTEIPNMDSLYESINPDALNMLFPESDSEDINLVFQYHGYSVRITGRIIYLTKV